jgi:hypothetical protein
MSHNFDGSPAALIRRSPIRGDIFGASNLGEFFLVSIQNVQVVSAVHLSNMHGAGWSKKDGTLAVRQRLSLCSWIELTRSSSRRVGDFCGLLENYLSESHSGQLSILAGLKVVSTVSRNFNHLVDRVHGRNYITKCPTPAGFPLTANIKIQDLTPKPLNERGRRAKLRRYRTRRNRRGRPRNRNDHHGRDFSSLLDFPSPSRSRPGFHCCSNAYALATDVHQKWSVASFVIRSCDKSGRNVHVVLQTDRGGYLPGLQNQLSVIKRSFHNAKHIDIRSLHCVPASLGAVKDDRVKIIS